jgi:uncharacterized protein DUF5908
MPIEIRELVVRARIEPGSERTQQDVGWRDSEPRDREQEQETVRACVREALRALADRNER